MSVAGLTPEMMQMASQVGKQFASQGAGAGGGQAAGATGGQASGGALEPIGGGGFRANMEAIAKGFGGGGDGKDGNPWRGVADMWRQRLAQRKVPSTEEIEREERLHKQREMWGSIGRGAAAIGNLFNTRNYAPNVGLWEDGEEERWRRLKEEMDGKIKDRDRIEESLNQAIAQGEIWDAEQAAKLAAAREARRQFEAKLAADAAKQKQIAADNAANRETRIEAAKIGAEARTNAARIRGRSGGGGGGGGGSKGFEWVHPETSKRYEVPKDRWAKSYMTLFNLVVDDMRPEPDERGYPNEEEWRRSCRGKYTNQQKKEEYIMGYLGSGRKGKAWEYFEKLCGVNQTGGGTSRKSGGKGNGGGYSGKKYK